MIRLHRLAPLVSGRLRHGLHGLAVPKQGSPADDLFAGARGKSPSRPRPPRHGPPPQSNSCRSGGAQATRAAGPRVGPHCRAVPGSAPGLLRRRALERSAGRGTAGRGGAGVSCPSHLAQRERRSLGVFQRLLAGDRSHGFSSRIHGGSERAHGARAVPGAARDFRRSAYSRPVRARLRSSRRRRIGWPRSSTRMPRPPTRRWQRSWWMSAQFWPSL